ADRGSPRRSPDESQITRHQREDAGREERDEAGGQRQRYSEPENTGADHGIRVHAVSLSTSWISVDRMEVPSMGPMMRAATRPCLSSTSVVGGAWIGVTLAKASLAWPVSASIRLG